MKIFYLLFTFLFSTTNSEPLIKNLYTPACRNCIYYEPRLIDGFNSQFAKCHKFGEKDIITDEITYRYADLCRQDENACGKQGVYFEKNKYININTRKFVQYIIKIIINPLFALCFLLFCILNE